MTERVVETTDGSGDGPRDEPIEPPVDERWALLRGLGSLDPLDLVPRLTLLVLLPHVLDTPLPDVVGALVVAGAVLDRRLFRSRVLWVVMATLVAAHLTRWWLVNEHDVVALAWCVTLVGVFSTSDPRRTMAVAGRVMLAVVMVLAVVAKARSPEFRSGDFLTFEMVADPRFEHVAKWGGGLSDAEWSEGRAVFVELRATPDPPETQQVAVSSRLVGLARGLTLGAVVVEGLLAVSMCWPGSGRRIGRVRMAMFTLFCVGAYAIVPVTRFGLMLVVLAIAQDASPHRRAWGVGLFALLLVYPPIWQRLLQVA